MLYVSTRNNTDLYTAYRALHESRAPDGGFFVPNRLQPLSAAELTEIFSMSFSERVARILNIFFPVGMTGWDIEFTIGRHPVKIVRMSHRLYIAELWHNLKLEFCFLENALFTKLCENDKQAASPTAWAKIAIRIAMLFGIYGELIRESVKNADFAGLAGDYSMIVAAFYAKKLGLPIGKIIGVSDEDGTAWDLFHKGELAFSASPRNSSLPLLDIVEPTYLEMLIYAFFDTDEVNNYLNAYTTTGVYRLNEEQLACLNQYMDGSVVSRVRCPILIRSIYRTHDYISDPYMAITYGALQDYRSRRGESNTALVLSDISPRLFEAMVTEATGVLPGDMRKIISNS